MNNNTCQYKGCDKPNVNGKYCSKAHAPFGNLSIEEDLEARWRRYVAEAKKIVRQMKLSRMEVAKAAIEATEFEGNGYGKSRTYTLQRFAFDIDLNYKTLLEWIQVYKKVVSKAPELGHLEQSNFEILRRARNQLNYNSSPKQIKEVVKKELSRNTQDEELIRGLKRLGTLRFFLEKKANLSAMDPLLLETTAENCRVILNVLNRFNNNNGEKSGN